jgi:predicted pyridoxine 5'-phosphate oxidase superfamily flavin-nucleotide-binding protein
MSIPFAQVRDYLSQPFIARLATLDEDGTPHVVPLWYVVENDRDEIVIMTDRETRKARNADTRVKGAVQIGGDPKPDGNGYTPGYLLQGEFVVATDTDKIAMKRITRHYLPPDEAEKQINAWINDDVVEIRLRVTNVIKVM